MKVTLSELRQIIRSVLTEMPKDPAGYMGAWVVITTDANKGILYKTGDKDTGKAKRIGDETEGEGPGYWSPNQKRAKVYTTEKGAQAGAMAEKMNGIKAHIKRIF